MRQELLTNLILRAQALMNTNWIHATQLLEQAAQADPNDARALISLGEFYMRREQYKEAVRKLESALRIVPDSDMVKAMIANSYFSMMDYNTAVVYYDMISEPGDDIKYNKALALYYAGKAQESLDITIELVQQGSNHTFIYFLVVEQLLKARRLQEALDYVHIAEKKLGYHSHLLLAKGVIYSQLGIPIKAYNAYNMADRLATIKNLDQLRSFAKAAYDLGLSDRAQELYLRILVINPHAEIVYEDLLRLLIERKEYNQARHLLKSARKTLGRLGSILKLLQARLDREERE